MKRIPAILFSLVFSTAIYAAHIAGGELQYRYSGPGSTPNSSLYEITLRLFRECSSNGPRLETEPVNIGIYQNPELLLYKSLLLPRVSEVEIITITPGTIACIIGNPEVCYQMALYSATVELANSHNGYTVAWVRCCRANGLMNTTAGNTGATYISRITGTGVLGFESNTSPQFVVKDTALVCASRNFMLDFGATDSDGDSLSYTFCDAYTGPNNSTGTSQYLSLPVLPYIYPYSGSQPLGPSVIIEATTGMISGIAPPAVGRYVVNVCVTEWRNGQVIGEHRKDFILKVGDCDFIAATLKPEYIMCDSLSRLFENESSASGIHSYKWEFGTGIISTEPKPFYTYPDTGVYNLSLFINPGDECSDTARATVRVFPGFTPDFNFNGSCYQAPFQFNDATYAAYGSVTRWKWDFGVEDLNNDTSDLKNPSYLFSTQGNRNVSLIVGSSKGCTDTIVKQVNVLNRPYLHLPFKDTLICSIDSLALIANGSGIFTWSPNRDITAINTANPIVFPKDTTTYTVTLQQNSCVATDSIKVNVLDYITVNTGADTAICKTDSIVINTVSHALTYRWTPAAGLSSTTAKSPKASPATETTYYIEANIGKCQHQDSITIRVSPYPIANAGSDTMICFGDRAQLHGSVVSSSFAWNPLNSLANSNTLSPVAVPVRTTSYILKATGFQECPKSAYDTVIVRVHEPVQAFAGNDTTVVATQPLQLHAMGGLNYEWTPAFNLNNPSIANPLLTLSNEFDTITYSVKVTTASGCSASDSLKIVIFKTDPDIFVPSGFTPNKDGKNDVLRPFIAGMKNLDFFRVFNRYGQVIYQTSELGKGWDGTLNGVVQPAGTYVFMVQAVNYKNEKVFRKGTTVLIR